MICDNCGKNSTHELKVTRAYGKGRTLLVIENVPVVSCLNCGETYLSSGTLQEIDRLKSLRRTLALKRETTVAEFAGSV